MSFRKIPDRWLDYVPMGKRIPGTRFIAFKVPLSEHLVNKMPEEEQFTPRRLLQNLAENNSQLGLIIDLTNTRRYYKPKEFTNYGIEYEKIFVEGKQVPSFEVLHQFVTAVNGFVTKYGPQSDYLIGVHCTHGVNRTGYLICRYMIERLGVQSKKAIDDFHIARGHPIERQQYLDALLFLNKSAMDEGDAHLKAAHEGVSDVEPNVNAAGENGLQSANQDTNGAAVAQQPLDGERCNEQNSPAEETPAIATQAPSSDLSNEEIAREWTTLNRHIERTMMQVTNQNRVLFDSVMQTLLSLQHMRRMAEELESKDEQINNLQEQSMHKDMEIRQLQMIRDQILKGVLHADRLLEGYQCHQGLNPVMHSGLSAPEVVDHKLLPVVISHLHPDTTAEELKVYIQERFDVGHISVYKRNEDDATIAPGYIVHLAEEKIRVVLSESEWPAGVVINPFGLKARFF